tara:strand:- start:17196 stop:17843 length:648 start_codon:yes stop_codon:yes gene_type:complete
MIKKKVAILISGRGSNMEALIKASEANDYPATIKLVISNKNEAYGLQIAKEYGIETKSFNRLDYKSDNDFDQIISDTISSFDIDIICTAGYLKILSAQFVNNWHNKIINIHPSLLPAYKGLHTHARALSDGVKITGCTTHIVRSELDSGPIIMQAAVPISDDDTEESLANKVLELEHKIFPLSLKKLAQDKLIIKDNNVSEKASLKKDWSVTNPG